MSPAAQAWLGVEKRARVLHCFHRVCSLIDEDGEVISIHSRGGDLDPIAAELDGDIDLRRIFWSAENLRSVRIGPGWLALGDLSISTREASLWDARLPTEVRGLPVSEFPLQDLLARIEFWLASDAPEGDYFWYGPSTSTWAGVPAGQPLRYTFRITTYARQRSAMAVHGFLAGLAGGDLESSVGGAAALAGFGGGLTPEGDDYILGALYAAWLIWPADSAREWSGAIARSAAPRTTPLSAAWLRAAARGEAGEKWHRMFRAGSGHLADGLDVSILAILGAGHSSGAAALAGFHATARLLAGCRETSSHLRGYRDSCVRPGSLDRNDQLSGTG